MRFRIFTEPQEGASYDELLAVARVSEELGFDAFFRSDHYLAIGKSSGLPGPTDAWTALAGLARETERVRLGTLVSPITFRSPGPLAIIVAQVDAMSGGRIELGLGTGWNDREHAAYGLPFPDTRERFERLEETLQIVTGLWTTPIGEAFSFDGRHYAVEQSPALPKPLQQPHPPIVMGGFGKVRTPNLAARFAAEFNGAFTAVPDYSPLMADVDVACEAIGRDPDTLGRSVAQTVVCGVDEAEFARRAAAIQHEPDALREFAIGGTPQEVVDRLGAYRDAGAQTAYLQILDLHDLDHLRLLAEEVVPALQ
jgi:F420-dependent oxidoreductase-like protein